MLVTEVSSPLIVSNPPPVTPPMALTFQPKSPSIGNVSNSTGQVQLKMKRQTPANHPEEERGLQKEQQNIPRGALPALQL